MRNTGESRVPWNLLQMGQGQLQAVAQQTEGSGGLNSS